MFPYIIMTLFILCSLIFIYIGLTKIINAPFVEEDKKNGNKLNIREIGFLEGNIRNLNEVIVIADKIEEPTDELLKSVRVNLKKGVKYIFLISNHNYDNEKNSYWTIFKAIGDSIKRNYLIENSVEIYSLNFDWKDYPYVFYRFFEFESKSQKAFAYMGTQINEGIADEYEFINPTLAKKLLDLAFQHVTIPEYEKISYEELKDSGPAILEWQKTA